MDAVTLDRVRVRSPGGAGPAERRAVARQLGGGDIGPPDLPPAAVLIVRRLADPLSGRLRRRAALPRPHPGWERAARERLAELHRAAARPARGAMPPDAPAVLFADPAELLACLTEDLLAGRHRERWWWRAVLRARPEVAGGGLAALLRGETERLPAVLALLHRRGRAAAAVETLGPGGAAELLDALLPELPAAAFSRSGTRRGAAVPPARQEPPHGDRGAGPGPAAGEASRAAPWSAWLDDREGRPAGREARCLLGVALALHHAPARARSRRFADEVARWWRSGGPEGAPAPDPPVPPPGLGETGGRSGSPATEHRASAPAAKDDRAEGDASGAGGGRPGAAAPAPARPAGGPATPCPWEGAGEVGVPAEPLPAEPSDPAAATGSDPLRPEPSPADAGSGPDPGVETALAGVFYLVAPVLELDLLERLGEVLRPADRVGGWGLLAHLARHLLSGGLPAGDSAEQPPVRSLDDDPLWGLLAALDRGDAQPAPPAPPEPTGTTLRPALRAWLDAADSEVAARLAEAGLPDAGLLAPGRVHPTATHVDVVIPIDAISLPVRRAGLDRDPGWVPGLGRIVLFHFE